MGIDLSPRMLAHALTRHGGVAGLEFREGDIQDEVVTEKFDHIVLIT